MLKYKNRTEEPRIQVVPAEVWQAKNPWNYESKAELARLWMSCVPDEDIAMALGRTKSSILSAATRYGLPGRGRDHKTFKSYPNAKIRNCISCGDDMWSEHSGNRMCVSCLKQKDGDWYPRDLM